jgi:hypothetical protein
MAYMGPFNLVDKGMYFQMGGKLAVVLMSGFLGRLSGDYVLVNGHISMVIRYR